MFRVLRLLAAALLAGMISPAWAASTIDSLPTNYTFPLPDPGSTTQRLWMTQGGVDYGITPTRLGFIYQGTVAPLAPYQYQQWWDTSAAYPTLKVYDGVGWRAIGGVDIANHGGFVSTPAAICVSCLPATLSGTGTSVGINGGSLTFESGGASVLYNLVFSASASAYKYVIGGTGWILGETSGTFVLAGAQSGSAGATAPAAAILTATPNGGIQIGAPTGADKGVGALNAVKLFYNGTDLALSLTTGKLCIQCAVSTIDNTTAGIGLDQQTFAFLDSGLYITWNLLFDQNLAAFKYVTNGYGWIMGDTGSTFYLASAPSGSAGGTTGATPLITTWTNAGGFQVGVPSGGDQGAGAINVSAGYYLNGAALPSSTTSMSSPANPTGTTDTSGKMMGLAGSFVPKASGKMAVLVTGSIANSTNADGAAVQCRYGTGSAPVNAAALTGTTIGSAKNLDAAPTALKVPFTCGGIVTGMTSGTTYWLDVGLAAITGGTASITNVDVIAFDP